MHRWPWWFWLPVSAGVVLRVAGLTASPLWYDEAFSLAMTRLPLLDMVRTAAIDFNPPLWEMVAWMSVRLFGVNEIGLRLPALAASIGALFVAADIGIIGYLTQSNGQQKIGLTIGLWAIALMPYQLWMAQEGRMYALMSLLYLAALRCVMARRWLGLTAVLGLMMYSHMVAPFYAATIGLYALWQERPRWRSVVASGAFALASFAPWGMAYVRSATGKDFWTVPNTLGWFITALVRSIMADSFLSDQWRALAMVTVLGSIAAALVVIVWRRNPGLGFIALGPFAFMLAASPIQNVIFYRTLSALTIPLLLWLAIMLAQLPTVFLKSFFATAWALIGIGGLLTWSAAAKGGELETLAEVINDEWQPGDVVYHATATSALPFDFYLDHPSWILDEKQHDGLLSWDVQDALGLRRAPLDEIPHGRAWVIWARDGFESKAAQARMAEYIRGGVLIGTVHYWQAAPIEVWRVERPGNTAETSGGRAHHRNQR